MFKYFYENLDFICREKGTTEDRLVKDINVPPRRINEIVLSKRSITADTALKLSEFFELFEKFWLNLQMRYDLEISKDKLKERLKREVKRYALAN